MDEKVTEWCEEMRAATRAEAARNRKRKAEQELENSRQAASARAEARARPASASASNAPIRRPATANFIGIAEQARQAAIAKDAYRAGRRVAPPLPPPIVDRVVNRRLAENNPDAFLRECFFDEHGRDTGDEPVALSSLCPADRAHLHQAASSLRLFHETTVTSVMVLGSGKNRLGAQMVKELNRQAGWPPAPYTPNLGLQTGDGEEDAEEEDDEENNEEWDITGE
jgi:hypothetical protein